MKLEVDKRAGMSYLKLKNKKPQGHLRTQEKDGLYLDYDSITGELYGIEIFGAVEYEVIDE